MEKGRTFWNFQGTGGHQPIVVQIFLGPSNMHSTHPLKTLGIPGWVVEETLGVHGWCHKHPQNYIKVGGGYWKRPFGIPGWVLKIGGKYLFPVWVMNPGIKIPRWVIQMASNPVLASLPNPRPLCLTPSGRKNFPTRQSRGGRAKRGLDWTNISTKLVLELMQPWSNPIQSLNLD